MKKLGDQREVDKLHAIMVEEMAGESLRISRLIGEVK